MSHVYGKTVSGIRRSNTIRTTSTTKSVADVDIMRVMLDQEAWTEAAKKVLQIRRWRI
jgi:hypothetical protein